MHIHNYQIHNVLDLYRRQLSRRNQSESLSGARIEEESDMAQISPHGRREIIMETISAEIVDRIVRHDGRPGEFREAAGRAGQRDGYNEMDLPQGRFTYTLIDEKDRRLINTLTLKEFSHGPEVGRDSDSSANLPANGEYC